LALIGISAATTVSAALIDASKDAGGAGSATGATPRPGRLTPDQVREGLQELESLASEIKAAEETLAAAKSAKPADPAAVTKATQARDQLLLKRVNNERELEKGGCVLGSRGFFTDLFSDQNGVAFHRYQMVVWTVVLGVVFVVLVYRDLAMPDFDASLLGLMGISSGTYIGFKFR
jgi:hypothetical protein